jgi:hypothetical protein
MSIPVNGECLLCSETCWTWKNELPEDCKRKDKPTNRSQKQGIKIEIRPDDPGVSEAKLSPFILQGLKRLSQRLRRPHE